MQERTCIGVCALHKLSIPACMGVGAKAGQLVAL